MEKHIRKGQRRGENRPVSLGELIHAQVRRAIEMAVEEELAAALGADRYERGPGRRGYRNGTKTRTLTGPTGPAALTLPRGVFTTATGLREWTSALVPRYQRRLREVNEAVLATYLAGGNTRRLRGALAPLLRAAPLSRSAVSRIVGTLKGSLVDLTRFGGERTDPAPEDRRVAEAPGRHPRAHSFRGVMPSGRETTAVDPSRAFGYGCSASLVELEANMKLPQRVVTVTLELLATPPVAAVAAGAYRPRIEEPR